MPTLDDILDTLSEHKRRATYGAVARVLNVQPQSLGALLGSRCPRASWVVNASTELPTGYSSGEIAPDLFANANVIRTPAELLALIQK